MRVCTDDRDVECVFELGERFLPAFPDDPGLHLMIANALHESERDVAAAAPEYLAFAESYGDADRVAIVRLAWAVALYRQRVLRELPSPALVAHRAALLEAIAAHVPLRPAEEARLLLLDLAVRLSDDGSVTAAALDAADRLEEIGDPASVYVAALALHSDADQDRAIRLRQRRLVERLLLSDPASPRYDAYLILDARTLPDLEAKRALDSLLRGGLSRAYEDDAWMLHAGLHVARTLPQQARAELAKLVYEGPRRNTTVNAALILAAERRARGDPGGALFVLDALVDRHRIEDTTVDVRRAELLSQLGRHAEALLTLQESLRIGGPDYRRWKLAAREHQLLGNEPEAVRLYQFYLAQLESRANGSSPFGPPAGGRELLVGMGTVWYRIVEMHPAFFGRAGMRQFVELLALLAAGLLAAARARRARAFLLPGAFAAELVFFSGLVGLRLVADGESIPALSWVWLGTASLRTFVLVAGGLYVSALVGLPRRTRAIAGPAIAAGGAALAGMAIGLVEPPLFVLEGLPGFARVAELGVAPGETADLPVLLVAALRLEAAARLVWPALILGALPASGLLSLPLLRVGGLALTAREGAAVVLAALLCSAGSAASFPLAAIGATLLGAARLRWGAAVPFLLHGAFAIGASAVPFLQR